MDSKLIFGLGLLIGGAVGAGIMHTVEKDKMNERINQEVQKYKNDISKTIPGVKSKAPVKDPLTSPLDPSLHAHSSIDGGPVSLDNSRTNYASMAPNYKKSMDDILAESESPSDDDPAEKVYPIRIISPEEYNANSECDTTDLIWYPDSDLLVDEYEEEVEERFRLIGNCLDDLLTRDSIPVDQDGLVYIINEDINIIYAVAVIRGDKNASADQV